MSKNCQKYLFLLSIGLLPLIPLMVGCDSLTALMTKSAVPDPVSSVDPEQLAEAKRQTAEAERQAAEAETARQTAEAEKARLATELEIAQRVAETGKTRLAEVEATLRETKAEVTRLEAARLETETEVARLKAEAEAAKSPPVDAEKTIDQTSPVDVESPVDTESPVQGGDFSLSMAGRQPMTVLVSQVDLPPGAEVGDAEDSGMPAEEPLPSYPPQIQPPLPPAPVVEQDTVTVQPPVVPQEFQRGEMPPGGQPRFQRGEMPPGEMPEGGQQRFQRGEMQRGDMQPRGGGYQQQGGAAQGPPGRGVATPPVQLPIQSVVRQPRMEPAESIIFNFRNAPWREVIEWFADQAALSLQINRVPTGTLNLVDGKPYTPAEALDVLNSYLLWQDYSLLRRGRVLFVVHLPDGIPPNLLEPITPDELDGRGKYEITKCVFNLNRTTPDIITAEIARLLGPQGSLVELQRSQQIVITETGGTLRTIRELIQRIDDPEGILAMQTVELKNYTGEEALQIMRTLLAVDANDASLRTVVDSSGKKVYISGRGDMVEKAKDMLQRVDSDAGGDREGQPQFNVYETGTADPATVLAVLQTLLVNMPDVRLSLDPRTNGISLYARLSAHATVRETIKQMQVNGPTVVLIPLKRMSPQTAVDKIKLFYETRSLAAPATTTGRNEGGSGRQQTASTAAQPPIVEPDTMARQITVRGTETQIAEIRSFLATYGEDGIASPPVAASPRIVPLSPTATALVLEQLQEFLPAIAPNINVIAPQTKPEVEPMTIMVSPPDESKTPDTETPDVDKLIDDTYEKTFEELHEFLNTLPVTRLMRVAEQPILAQVVEQSGITITATPNGFVITGGDPETQDKVEALIRMLSDETLLGEKVLKEYLLSHSTPSIVSTTLQTLMGTATGLGASGLASVDVPDLQYPELMGLLGARGGSAIEKTGDVTITVDERRSALLIYANRVDHKTIEGLLKLLDQPRRDSADVKNQASPRNLPLRYIRKDEAKTLVEQAFAAKMQGNRQQGGNAAIQMPQARGGPQGGPQGGPEAMMQQVMQAMQQNARGQQQREQEPQMTVVVSPTENALIITSTEATFNEVKAFMEEQDERASQREVVMERVQLVYTTPSVAGGTLQNLLGPAATFTTNRATPQQTQFGSGGGTFGGGMGGTFGGGNMMMGGMQQRPGGTTFGGGGGTTFGGGNMMMGGMQQQRPGSTTFGGGTTMGGMQQQRPGGTTFGGGTTMSGMQQQRPGGTTGGGTTFGGGAMGGGQRAGGGR